MRVRIDSEAGPWPNGAEASRSSRIEIGTSTPSCIGFRSIPVIGPGRRYYDRVATGLLVEIGPVTGMKNTPTSRREYPLPAASFV